MRPAKEDLKKAPPEGQVTELSHCGDTYIVKTADGEVNKVWEFNLRLKTDSSALGASTRQTRDRPRRDAGRPSVDCVRGAKRDKRLHSDNVRAGKVITRVQTTGRPRTRSNARAA